MTSASGDDRAGGGAPAGAIAAPCHPGRHLTLFHWGAYEVETDAGGEVVAVHPWEGDPDPSPIGRSALDVAEQRVMRPSVRRSWLSEGPGARPELRGVEPFVEVDWDTALDLVAGEVQRVRAEHGNAAIYAGSYGWSSAGRFHHAQSQIHRFTNLVGGATLSVNTYSLSAAEVIVPHVLGTSFEQVQADMTSFSVLARETELLISFGGVPLKNAQVQYGGQGRHSVRGWLDRCRERGMRTVNIGPVRSDLPGARWLAARPNTDLAVMLAMIHTLVAEGLHDDAFCQRYCVGWDRLRAYVMGRTDATPKDAAWAAEISGLDAADITALAIDAATHRTMVNAAWALQRAHRGEHVYWGVIALAAALGQIGLPGGGFGLGYGAVSTIGNGVPRVALPKLPRKSTPVRSWIPVSRISDALLGPGTEYRYNGEARRYPDLRMIYWAGGNPFHHHQDLGRLVEAWRRPETIVVHEPFWTATARRADIVLPVTTPLERNDLGGSPDDDHLFAMHRVIDPVGEARDDYDVFAELAQRLGEGDRFTEGRSADEWVVHLYGRFAERNPHAPSFEDFWESGVVVHPAQPDRPAERVLLEDFRDDPDTNRLPTMSGRIELWSAVIDALDLDDCPPHPAWDDPPEWLGDPDRRWPLHLVSNQPPTRLHSQWDHGVTSREAKVAGREALHLHPDDAAARSIATGDTVLVRNDRGACYAGAVVDDGVMPGVVVLPTGAWYDPEDPSDPRSPCRAGNPNVLTRDVGTSSLAQGPTAHTCLVEVQRV